MANKKQYVRERFPITETDKSMKITIEVSRYASMINVNGNPVGNATNPALSAMIFIGQAMDELETRWAKKQEQDSTVRHRLEKIYWEQNGDKEAAQAAAIQAGINPNTAAKQLGYIARRLDTGGHPID
jgi:hypothetical protein